MRENFKCTSLGNKLNKVNQPEVNWFVADDGFYFWVGTTDVAIIIFVIFAVRVRVRGENIYGKVQTS